MSFSEQFKKWESQLSSQDKSSWMHSFRKQGMEAFNRLGLPTRKNEEWKYTSVKVLQENEFTPALLNDFEISVDLEHAIETFLNPAFYSLVFINGILNEDLSSELPQGVLLNSLSTGEDYIQKTPMLDAFSALNAAYLQHGVVIQIKANTLLDRPIHIFHYTYLNDGSALSVYPRFVIVAEKRCKADIIESYFGEDGARYFVNAHTEVHVQDSARLSYNRVQAESLSGYNIARTTCYLASFAQFESLAFACGSQLSRHNLDVIIQGQGASAQVNGLYIVKGSQVTDNHTKIDFTQGHSTASQLYKGILDDESKGVFNGQVIIRKDSQKANSEQLNNNLLLSRKAEADSKPELEIYADDVKATHGSTVGQVNQDEIFYLQSRAIKKEKALEMLSLGFAIDVIYRISNDDIREWLLSLAEIAFKRQVGPK